MSRSCKPGMLDAFEIGGGVERLDPDALGRRPVEALDAACPSVRRAPAADQSSSVFAENPPSSAIVLSRAAISGRLYGRRRSLRPSAAGLRKVCRSTIAAVSSSTAPA